MSTKALLFQKSGSKIFFSLLFFLGFFPALLFGAYGDGNYGDSTYGDITAPTLAEVTPVTTPTTDTTPDYTFSSSEGGLITYGGSCSSATTSASSGNNTITFNTLGLGTYSNCTITVTDASENESSVLNVSSFTITASDSTAPTLSEVTPVTTPTSDTTPDYTFNTNEAGTITYGGSCSSATTSASSGNNTITFNTLGLGTYSNCTITVTDVAANASTPLAVTTFTVVAADNTAPILTEVTPVPNPTTDTTPDYTFNTDEAGTITYGGSCSSATTSASSGNNTITFNTLGEGTYTTCTIRVTDAASNISSPLSVSEFTVIVDDPGEPEPPEVEIDLSRPKLKWVDEVFKLFRDAYPKLNKKEFVVSGNDPGMANGEIRFYIEGQKHGKTTVDENGDWDKKIRSSKSGKVELELKYKKGDFEEEKEYTLLIDSEDPIFEKGATTFNKRAGDRVFWNATDNDRIDYYRYEFQDKEVKTKESQFFLPTNIAPGRYNLLVKAYDRAGNKTYQGYFINIVSRTVALNPPKTTVTPENNTSSKAPEVAPDPRLTQPQPGAPKTPMPSPSPNLSPSSEPSTPEVDAEEPSLITKIINFFRNLGQKFTALF